MKLFDKMNRLMGKVTSPKWKIGRFLTYLVLELLSLAAVCRLDCCARVIL